MFSLQQLPFSARDNYEIMLKYVEKDGLLLKYASASLRDEYNIVKAAIKSNHAAFAYASTRLRSSGLSVCQLTNINHLIIHYVTDEVKNSYGIMEHMLFNSSCLCEFPNINDLKLIYRALKFDPTQIQFVREDLLKTTDVIEYALEEALILNMPISEKILNKHELFLEIITKSPARFDIIPQALKTNKTFMLKAIAIDGLLIKHWPNPGRYMALAAVTQNPSVYTLLSVELREDPEIMLAVI